MANERRRHPVGCHRRRGASQPARSL